MILSQRGWIDSLHLPPFFETVEPVPAMGLRLPEDVTVAEAERLLILHTLDTCRQQQDQGGRDSWCRRQNYSKQAQGLWVESGGPMKVASKVATGSGITIVLLLAVLIYDLSQVQKLTAINRDLAEIGLTATTITLEQSRLSVANRRVYEEAVRYLGCRLYRRSQRASTEVLAGAREAPIARPLQYE